MLDGLAFFGRRGTVVDRNPVVGTIRVLNRCGNLLMQVALGVVVFGKNEHAQVGPCRARLSHSRAHLLANPFQQFAHAAIGEGAGVLGDLGHLIEELLLLVKLFFIQAIGRGQRRDLYLGVFFGLQVGF
ncbi:MAG: hypothetical protein E6K70_26690, partial [Planctomycetota bacterium]